MRKKYTTPLEIGTIIRQHNITVVAVCTRPCTQSILSTSHSCDLAVDGKFFTFNGRWYVNPILYKRSMTYMYKYDFEVIK